MDIPRKEITIREILKGMPEEAMDDEKLLGWDKKLEVRPSYQREYLHDNNPNFKRELIHSICNNRPIGVIYFAQRSETEFELLDGQQRIITIWKFHCGEFHFLDKDNNKTKWNHLKDAGEDEIFLDYKLHVYICKGTEKEKMHWFRTINTGSEKLHDQELRNAIYNSKWVSDAKKYFTKRNNPKGASRGKDSKQLCDIWLEGSRERQGHLEQILKWKTYKTPRNKNDIDPISTYMINQSEKPNASDLWEYFLEVTAWASNLFPSEEKTIKKDHQKPLKKNNWGEIYDKYRKSYKGDPKSTKQRAYELLDDDTVDKESGIYEFILSNETDYSFIRNRNFSERIKKAVWKKQKKICPLCGNEISLNDAHADHIKPFSKGGTTTQDNCQVTHAKCNQQKGAK